MTVDVERRHLEFLGGSLHKAPPGRFRMVPNCAMERYGYLTLNGEDGVQVMLDKCHKADALLGRSTCKIVSQVEVG